jgi:CheY-like chemotaxis protein
MQGPLFLFKALKIEVAMYSSSILLVQPQADSASHLRQRLEGKGYTVVEAPDARSAMHIAKSSEIGLIVTELYMPVGKSRCLARLVGQSPSLDRTKILAYTTHGKKQDRAWAHRIGADGYVITRSGEDRVLAVVDHLLAERTKPRRVALRSRRAT